MLVADNPYNDWYIGLSIGFLIVVVVVILVAIILTLAERIGSQAGQAVDGVEAVRVGTTPLWAVQSTNASAVGILAGARKAREVVVAHVTGAAPSAAPPSPAPPAPPAAPTTTAAPPPPQPGGTHPEPPGVLGPDAYPNRGRGA